MQVPGVQNSGSLFVSILGHSFQIQKVLTWHPWDIRIGNRPWVQSGYKQTDQSNGDGDSTGHFPDIGIKRFENGDGVSEELKLKIPPEKGAQWVQVLIFCPILWEPESVFS